MPLLQAHSITKRFGAVLANDRVDFTLEAGEVHAVLGENGAGKSTLMHILSGLYLPDTGRITLRGQEVHFRGPRDAQAAGIGMVYQHFMLVPTLTVTENILLGMEQVRRGWAWLRQFAPLDRRGAAEQIRALSQRYGLEVDPDALVQDLPIGVQQRVEILKVLFRGADILILDEPTATLTPQESDALFVVLRALAKEGKAIVFITHKLHEVYAVADRITVLRQGQKVGTMTVRREGEAPAEPIEPATPPAARQEPRAPSEAELVQMMVGSQVAWQVERTPASVAEVAKLRTEEVLRVENLVVYDERGHAAVNGASLTVHAGEIVGIVGVQGNGQTELVEALTGLRPCAAGRIVFLNCDVTRATPRQRSDAGMAHIPEDRQRGAVMSDSIADNLILTCYYRSPFARGIVRNEEAIARHAATLMTAFDVRAPNSQTPLGALSGGNQQKVLLARALSQGAKLIVASQPTRGLDVASSLFVRRRLMEASRAGAAVLWVSADLDEMLSVADRIAVMYRGKIVGVLSAAEATRERV
ncbi:MAG: ABC transporter ATP-binding protein, partial [Abditibacteriales bacterium]|nr:ABC transporter ATP-binding protein [Abditibacteriales bacterium]